MLRFFSKMRLKLAAENKVSKYLRYAVGEIVLVVIGILIALQINSWNQDRLNRKTEKDYIIRLSNEIKTDTAYFNSLKNLFEEKETSLIRILKIWQKSVPVISDSMQYINDFISAGNISSWYIEPVTWTQLVQTGDLKLIRDQLLTDELFRYYNSIKRIADNYNQHPTQLTNEARERWHEPFLQENPEESLIINKIPDRNVFDYIWKNRKLYENLYSALAYSSMWNKNKMQMLVDDGTKVLEILNSKLATK